MLLLRLLVLSLIGSSVVAVPWNGNPPTFCHSIDCPEFQVVSNTSTFEIRRYAVSSWVSTKESGTSWKTATSTAFMRLFGFISGKNSQGQSIPMTAPVTVQVSPGAGPNCDSEFVVSFYLPYALQGKSLASLPQPNDSSVFLRNQTAITVAVRSYGGFSTDSDVTSNIEALGEDLTDAKIPFSTAPYFTAGYDSPFTVFNRHNEVWLSVSE